jgi:diguanylate cyclase (GGDEF)-like protein
LSCGPGSGAGLAGGPALKRPACRRAGGWARWAGAIGLAGALVSAHAGDAAEIARLDDAGRARPQAVHEELERLRASLPVDDPDLLQVLRIQGRLANRLAEESTMERAAGQLEQWSGTQADPVRRADGLALAKCLRADRSRLLGPLSRADRIFEEVLPALTAQSDPQVRLSCLLGSAAVKENLGQFEPAMRRYQEAIRLADAQGLVSQRVGLRAGLANVLRRAGQVEQGFVVNDEARRIAAQHDDWLSLSEALTVHAILLDGSGREAEELQALEQSIEYARRAGADRDEGVGLANLADYYLQKGDYPRALALARQALPLSTAAKDPIGRKLALVNGGLALIAMHRKAEGLAQVQQSLDHDRRADEIVSMAETLVELGQYLEAVGDLPEAYAAYAQHRALAEQVSLRERQHAMLELQEQFEADSRRRERSLLHDDNQLKEEQLRQQALRFRLWALAAALAAGLLVLVGLLYRRMRQVQSELRHTHQHLKVQSEQDVLTGLSNRRHGQAVMAARPHAQGTLYLLDLDHFKRINDRFGHAAGDVVLAEVARRLRAVVREQDQVVRWGGEEFLILVDGGTEGQADLLAQRLLAALASLPVVADTRHMAVTTSIGYASFPLQPQGLEVGWDQALDLVDAAMYLAKTRGRNRACGLRRVAAADGPALAGVLQDVERAWRDDRLVLAEWHGPAGVGEQA